MNKTFTVNLGGSIFNVEEDAFHLLKNYLDRIKLNFAGDPGEGEIMLDIEARIAELFHQHLNERKNVIVRRDVEEVITVMGQPEDFDTGDHHRSAPQDGGGTRNSRRRIFRDKDDAVVGGVCGGLSHYLGWDPVILRIAFVLLAFISFGTAIIGYIIFWAVVPPAQTTAERLQMRGEPVNVENISRFIKEEAKTAGENFERWSRSAPNQGNEALKTVGLVLTKAAGVFFTCLGLGLLIGLVSLLFFAEFNLFGGSNITFDQFNQLIFVNDGSWWMVAVGIILAMGIPALALIYAGIKLITGYTRRVRGIGWSLLALFIVGMVLLAIGGIRTGKQFASDADLKHEFEVPVASGDTLFVEVLNDEVFTGRSQEHRDDFFDLVRITTDSVIYGEPVHVSFERVNADNFRVRVERSSQGPGLDEAGKLASNIGYDYYLDGNRLELMPWLTTPATDPFRGQHVDITVFVPEGKYVHFGQNIGLISWRDEFAGKTVMMTEDGWEDWAYDEHNHRRPFRREQKDSVVLGNGDIRIQTETVIEN